MIEISHRQAQRLIRQRIDGPIPDEQWAVLQAHLEGCEECRAYQAGLERSERSMRRVLRLRWSPVHGPRQALETTVKTRRAGRKQARKIMSYLAISGLVLFLGVLYAGYRRATAPPPTPTPNLAAIRWTPTPAPARTTFRGVIAFADEDSGNSEIFLLNPGITGEDSELVNMTNDPGADTHPAWSPDGEWLAFLSDRSGKNEVYVVHVAGSRLTKITNDPGVEWHGPLTWSPDGAWIALTGTPVSQGIGVGPEDSGTQNEDAWVYLIPLRETNRDAGAGPRKLGLTRGVMGRARFSPAYPTTLAYPAADPSGSTLVSYELESGRFNAMTAADNQAGLRAGMYNAFDWSADGRLAYIAEGPVDPATGEMLEKAGTQVRTTLSPAQFGGGTYNSSSNQLIHSLPGGGMIRQVAYVPGREGREYTAAYLLDEDADGCWTLTLRLVLEGDAQPRGVSGLCVDGPFSRESFTPDGRWLVVSGHLPGESETGLYAVRLPDVLGGAEQEDRIERLADAPAWQGGPAEGPPAQAMVRPGGQPLGISPRSAPEQALPPPVASIPGSLPGQVVFSLVQGIDSESSRSPLYAVRPNGRDLRALPVGAEPGEHSYSCPAISPDGTQIAFLSDRESGAAWQNEVFVMDANGENARRVARNIFARYSEQAAFDCPAWSPDGTRLAAVVRGESGDQLAVISLAEDAAVTYLPVSATSFITRPVWSPDGTRVLLAHPREGQTPPSIASVSLAEEGETPVLRTLVESDGWGEVAGFAYSPDGAQIAYVAAYYRANLPTQLQLRLIDADGGNPRSLGQLPEWRMGGMLAGNGLEWGDDNRLSFMVRGAMHEKVKSHLFVVGMGQTDTVEITTVAALDDIVLDAAWSPNRRWWMLATESGLYAVNVEEAFAGQSTPAQISSARVYEVDWR